MTDVRLRTLERRWRETGASADHACYLVERLRTGELPVERARLAAYLGDAAAREALGIVAETEAASQRAWAAGLHAWRDPVPARVALAAARAVLPVFDRGLNPDPRPRRALRAGEACVVCPCEAHAARAATASEDAEAIATDDAGTAVWAAVRASFGQSVPERPSSESARTTASRWNDLLETAVVAAGRVAGVVAVRSAVRDAVVPWALKYDDPLARRMGRSSGS